MSKSRRRYFPTKTQPIPPKAVNPSFDASNYDPSSRRQYSWTFHDLTSIAPLTLNQERMFDAFDAGDHLVAYGSPGTGKTFIGLYLALQGILHPESLTKMIIIVRSAVPTRDIGYLPGTLEEKTALYENPYRDVIYEIVGRFSTYDDMKRAGLIQFCTTSFIRSLTWNNAIVILDEGQSCTFHEINSVVTRLGEHSRLIVLGDLSQNDLAHKRGETSGMERFLQVMTKMPDTTMVHFTRDDIVRSQFVRDWIVAVEETP